MKILNLKLNSNKYLLLTIFSTLLSILYCKKDIELKEDFIAEIDYRFEKLNSTWRRRGVINFVQKNPKNGKQNFEILNNELTKEHLEEIKSECKLGNGLYYVRIKSGTNLFFSSLNSCELIKNNFHDKFIINHFGHIKSDSIISINYDTDSRYILGSLGNEEKRKRKDEKNNSSILKSSLEFVDTVQSIGPIFPEEKPEAKGGPGAEQQSFLSKYWWVIMIVVFMMMTKGAGPEEGQGGERAASGSSE